MAEAQVGLGLFVEERHEVAFGTLDNSLVLSSHLVLDDVLFDYEVLYELLLLILFLIGGDSVDQVGNTTRSFDAEGGLFVVEIEALLHGLL